MYGKEQMWEFFLLRGAVAAHRPKFTVPRRPTNSPAHRQVREYPKPERRTEVVMQVADGSFPGAPFAASRPLPNRQSTLGRRVRSPRARAGTYYFKVPANLGSAIGATDFDDHRQGLRAGQGIGTPRIPGRYLPCRLVSRNVNDHPPACQLPQPAWPEQFHSRGYDCPRCLEL